MQLKLPIYLDHNATTPCDPRVVEVMLPYFTESFGNAASRHHSFGWKAEAAVDLAREQVASLIGAEPNEIVFTSGATEAVNLALKGAFDSYAQKGKHIITCTTEHKAVIDTCNYLEKQGAEITYLPVQSNGLIHLPDLEAAIRPDTIVVSLMYANNETGVIQSIEKIGEVCRAKGVLLFTDATQAVGKIPVDVNNDKIDMLAMTAHKMYGPKGVGALYIRRKNPRVRITPQLHGGGHERGMRSGTLNVPGIVGFGKAAAIAQKEMSSESGRLSSLRDQLENALLQIEETAVNGDRERRLPHVTNMSFKHADGEGLMMAMNKEIAISSGSACTSASIAPSHVLKALGLDDDVAHASLRFGLGRYTTGEEINYTIEKLKQAVNNLREMSPVWKMYKQGLTVNN